ncbi:hypothetical protein ACO0SA_001955 [Hanseniaspora valbyensis]
MNFHQRRVLFLHTTKNLAYVGLVGLSIAIIVKTTNRLKREHKFANQGEKQVEDVNAGRGLADDDKYLEYYKQKADSSNTNNHTSLANEQEQYIEQIKNRKRGPRLTFSLWDYFFSKDE